MNDQPSADLSDPLYQRIDLNFALQAAGLGAWELDPASGIVYWDQQARSLFGIHNDPQFPYERAIQHIHPEDQPRVEQAVGWAINPQSDGFYDQTYRTIGVDDAQLRWVRFIGRAYFSPDGALTRFGGIAQEVTRQWEASQQREENRLAVLRQFEQAPVGIATLSAQDLVFQSANALYSELVGRTPQQLIGKPLLEALPEVQGQGFDTLLCQVIESGQPFIAQEVPAQLLRQGQLQTNYFKFIYQPQRDNTGQVESVLVVGVEVTQQVVARQQAEASEAKLNLLSNTVPSMIFYLDQQQRYQSYNKTFQDWFQVDAHQVIGLTVREFLGERNYQRVAPHLAVAYAGQPERYTMLAPSRLKTERWLDITYTPHLDEAGQLLGVIVLAIDISEYVKDRQALQESKNSLENAIRVGELGTFSVDIASGQLTCSPRVAEWFGFASLTADTERFINGVGEDEQEMVRQHLAQTIQAGLAGRYDITHSIIHAHTGQRTLIHALGRVYLDDQGQPQKVDGIAQDITAQHELQSMLASQVQERTQALQLANIDLQRSNENLQQFAYIASHDLQEPLRKIQAFSSLLEQQLAGHLTELSETYLQRISSAGARMSTLIKDLLAYSRISTRQQAFGLVSLEAILDQVRSSLDWAIAERGAQIRADELPVIPGDESQLSQLFQNLLSNAIKFTPVGQAPQIQIQCFQRERHELPPEVRPTGDFPRFIQISVHDQGIGFDLKYLDRIFQVFQRLHGKNEFAGTGVGLAICQKVVENHGGAITADSQPGQGATFCVYLPT